MASILLNAVVARTCPPGLSVCCSKLRKPTGPARARRACQRWTFRALSIDLSGCSFTRASAPKSAKNYPWEPEESRKKDDYLIGKLKAWRKDHKSASFQLPFRKLTVGNDRTTYSWRTQTLFNGNAHCHNVCFDLAPQNEAWVIEPLPIVEP